ncbi:MAG TPA: response regulator transcription factor [Solirubrobacteraceae bacterium]|jgi:two-component system nitrate/nitrite response regulator NarL|nr:response regulator transcription factor [Solirubrobacteraceae bacterium]
MSRPAHAAATAAEPAARGKRTGVVVADDHPLYRAALEGAIGSCDALQLLATASDGGEALEAIRRHRPDVAVLDMRMPKLDGQAVVRRLRALELETRVLFVSEYHDGELVLDSLGGGAAGYLAKSATAAEICAAVRQVAAGECVLPTDLGNDLVSAIRDRTYSSVRLSEREHTVLQLIADGNTARLIARELHLAVPTVKTHTKNLYAKLGVSDRGAAVAEAMRRGLVE